MTRYKMTLVLLAMLAVCSSAHSASRPDYGGTLRVAYSPRGWIGENTTERELLVDLVCEPLWMSPRSLLTSISEIPSDTAGHLLLQPREGVFFHDGEPFTDVVLRESLKDYSLPAGYHSWIFGEAPRYTSGESRERQSAYLAEGTLTLSLSMIPALMAPSFELLRPASGSFQTTLVGTGPFILSSLDGGIAYLDANESHWAGRPFLDSVVLKRHENPERCALALRIGEADAAWVTEGLIEASENDRFMKLGESESIWIIGMNSRPRKTEGADFLSSSSKRLAFANALRLEELTRALLGRTSPVPRAIFLPQALESTEGTNEESLLAEPGRSLVRVVFPSQTEEGRVIARRLQAVLLELGYQPQLAAVGEAELHHRLGLGQFEIAVASICPRASDPMVNLASFYSNHVAEGPFSLSDQDEAHAALLFEKMYANASIKEAAQLEELILSSGVVVPVTRTKAELWVSRNYTLAPHSSGELSDLWRVGSE